MQAPRICIWNAALDTGNLGVQALGLATIAALYRRFPEARFTVFSDTPGVSQTTIAIGGENIRAELIGASLSRKLWKPGNLYVEFALSLFGNARWLGVVSSRLREAHLILDVSGGDSFTTLYGPYRYRYVAVPKRLSLQFNAPLVFLPQTYGPFADDYREDAGRLLASAAQVWARDHTSQMLAQELTSASSVGLSPDIAFSLPASVGLDANSLHGVPTVGVNVSGLIYNQTADRITRQFGIRCAYQKLMCTIVMKLLQHSRECRIILVPHVAGDGLGIESDSLACADLFSRLSPNQQSRVSVGGIVACACRAKALMKDCDYFIGTRMHACIGALSTGVPTTAIAYSGKSAGVFETVGLSDWVVDPRSQDIDSIVADVINAFERREEHRLRLSGILPSVFARIDAMFDEVCSLVQCE